MSAGRWRARARRWSRPAAWRTAAWAWRAVRATRHVSVEQLRAAPLVPAPPAGADDPAPVEVVLGRTGATCLPRALVRQAWDGAHGRPRDVVVGVRAGGERYAAHAWLDGDPAEEGNGFVEITRRPSGAGIRA